MKKDVRLRRELRWGDLGEGLGDGGGGGGGGYWPNRLFVHHCCVHDLGVGGGVDHADVVRQSEFVPVLIDSYERDC